MKMIHGAIEFFDVERLLQDFDMSLAMKLTGDAITAHCREAFWQLC